MSNPIPPTFQEAFDALSAAVATAQGAGKYYQQLPGALESINTELKGIAAKIQRIVTELAQKTAQVAANEATIRDLTGRSGEITNELAASREETERIRRESEAITSQVGQLNAEKEAQLAQQKAELARLEQEHRENLEREKQTNSEAARRAIEEKDIENAEKQAKLREEMEQNKQDSQERLAELQRQANELNARAEASQSEVATLNATKQQLAETITRLEGENAELKRQILDASGVMESAKLILQQLTPENRDAITKQIKQLNDHIGRINEILDSESEFVEARESALSGNTKFTQQYSKNDRTWQKTFTLEALLAAVNAVTIKNKDRLIEELINANTEEKIYEILSKLKPGQLAEILERVVETRGGRKTRRYKKHGRKTRRKQRGGFKYSAHARRTSITTSRRRSSRPTSTTSRRTTRSSSR